MILDLPLNRKKANIFQPKKLPTHQIEQWNVKIKLYLGFLE